MPRYYVKKDEKWNVFSSIVDDFLYSDFMSFEELKALVIGEVVVEKLKDLKTLLTNRPKLNTMPFNEAMEIIKSKDEPQTHEIRTNTHECVKDTHDKTESNSEKPNNSTISKMEQVEDEPQIEYCDTCRFEDYSSSKEPCNSCLIGGSKWQPKDEPQTERSE